MKIAVLGNKARDMGNFWSVLMRHMRGAGHEILCMVPAGDAAGDAALLSLGARLRHYPLDRKGLNPLHDLRTLGALLRLLREERPDALFAFTIKPVIYGCIAARLARVPHIFATITGLGYAFEADSPAKKCIRRLAALLYRTALRGAQTVFFQNREDIRAFREAGILSSAAEVVLCRGTGVDTRRFFVADAVTSPLTFLLVGRLLEAKGLPEFAQAARILKERYPDARFQILGPPEQGLGSVPLETVRAWEREGCLEYLGETRDVRPYVAAASVIVLPSWREGTPCSVMEGMSMGRPAVVTDAPGCREVVEDGVNGFRVPVRNARALASAMEKFLRDPSLVAGMGAAGRQLAETAFDAEKVATQILAAMRLPSGASRSL